MRRDTRDVMTSSARQNWGTPKPDFKWLHWCFDFSVDACAEKWNAKLSRYWSVEDNGLRQDSRRERVWNNCEYDSVAEWLPHSKHESMMGSVWVNLVASRPDTRWFRAATEQDMGPLQRSYFVPETRVLWLVWRDLVVGVYHHDVRLKFDVPPGTRDKNGQLVKRESAPFPSSLIIHAARARFRLPKLEPARKLLFHPGTGRPLLTYRMPE